MNQGFKLRFDQLRENDPTSTGPETGAGTNEFYSSPGYTRNICLVWPDGRQAFLNYGYVVACEFERIGENILIRLGFSSHSVSLYGYSLEKLFMNLLHHLPRIIVAVDERYRLHEDSPRPVVIEMTVEKQKD